jgi:hypothetical protein
MAYRIPNDNSTMGQYVDPDRGVLSIVVNYASAFKYELSATIAIDPSRKEVKLTSLSCQCENIMNERHWPETNSGGGVSLLSNVEYTFEGGVIDCSVRDAVCNLFGSEWIPIVQQSEPYTSISAKNLAIAQSLRSRYDDMVGQEGTILVVALFDTRRQEAAATTIQRFYRGWNCKRSTAFNPNHFYGRHLLRKKVDEWVAEGI